MARPLPPPLLMAWPLVEDFFCGIPKEVEFLKLQMEWMLIHLPSVYNAIVSHLKMKNVQGKMTICKYIKTLIIVRERWI